MRYKNLILKRPILLLLCCCFSAFAHTGAWANCRVYFSHCPEGKLSVTDCDGNGYESISWPQPIAATTGGCTNFSMYQVAGPVPGAVVAVGTYTIEYNAVAYDILTGEGSKASCTFTVTVSPDTEPPVFTFCPPDITLYTGSGSSVTASWPLPTATDNCVAKIKGSFETPCNSEFGEGDHQIVYVAQDAAGNVAYCYFTITVIAGYMRPGVVETPSEANNQQETVLRGAADNELEAKTIFLLPNPFKEKLSINVNEGFETDLFIQAFDIQGRLLLSQTWGAQTNQVVLNSESVKPGVILIKIVSSDGAFCKVLRGVKL